VQCIAAAITLIMTVSACNGDDDSGDASTPPLPTPPATSTPSSHEEATTSPGPSDSSTTSLNPVPSLTDPTTPTTAAIDVPPVPTLVPEVSPELLTPDQLDPNSVNNNRPVLPEHLPVLQAHLEAIQANTAAYSRWPIDPEAPELVAAPVTPESLARIQESLRGRLARGEVLDVSQGVTFRPYVVGPVTDAAVLFDCELAGHYWKNAATGELVPPNEVWPAGPGRVVQVGLQVDMVNRDGRWLVAGSQIDPQACA
jgi:hypothetical protein